MKLALVIVLGISLLSYSIFYFTADKPSEIRMNMPWQVTVHAPMHSEVFGIVLNKTTLQQALQQLGKLDGMALFQNPHGQFSLEAYFGKVKPGPFGARLIATLDGPQDELENLTLNATKRTKTQNDSHKWTLSAQQQLEQHGRLIRSLTYIPDYSGLDKAYLQQHFGPPAEQQKVDETTELWFYPDSGIRIMYDADGKEMFEYSAPAQFLIQDAVEAQH